MLDLKPFEPHVPDPEFLVRLLTGQASHQAIVRARAGKHFKNLENLVRGRHQVTATSRTLLANDLHLSTDELDELDGANPDGPLMPELLGFFQVIENFGRSVLEVALSKHVACHCCGSNLIADVQAWWQREAPGLGEAEYRFIERLIVALQGYSALIRAFSVDDESADMMISLANPERHPIGNWLAKIQVALRCNSLSELAVHMQLQETAPHENAQCEVFSHARLKKWSSGQDVMPFKAAEALLVASKKTNKAPFIMARTLALATEFLSAAMPRSESPKREESQRIIRDRLEQVWRNVLLGTGKHIPMPAKT